MKKALFISLISLLSLTGFAQNSTKAKTLLDEVSQKVASYKNISLSFDYILDNESENIHQETNGKVNLKGDKYHLNLSGVERIFDGKYIYTIAHEDEEVVISNGTSDEESDFTPSKILTFYKKGYTYQWDALKTIGGKKIQFVKLLPINTNDDNKYILLGIDTKSKNIYQVAYTNKNNSITTFKIRSFKSDITLPPNEFGFNEAKYIAKDYIITRL
jgi:outer membrane lipoprotein-sorting protein